MQPSDYILGCDIDENDAPAYTNTGGFQGYFEGAGYSLRLAGRSTGDAILGGFANELRRANVRNLTIEPSGDIITSYSTGKAGALAGHIDASTVFNVVSENSRQVKGTQDVGGLIGNVIGNVTRDSDGLSIDQSLVIASAYVTTADEAQGVYGERNVGGLVGHLLYSSIYWGYVYNGAMGQLDLDEWDNPVPESDYGQHAYLGDDGSPNREHTARYYLREGQRLAKEMAIYGEYDFGLPNRYRAYTLNQDGLHTGQEQRCDPPPGNSDPDANGRGRYTNCGHGDITEQTAKGFNIGGLVGYSQESYIHASVSHASVAGQASVGGLVGAIAGGGFGSSERSEAHDSYSSGFALGARHVGGSIGKVGRNSTLQGIYSRGDAYAYASIPWVVTGDGDNNSTPNNGTIPDVKQVPSAGGFIGLVDTNGIQADITLGEIVVTGLAYVPEQRAFKCQWRNGRCHNRHNRSRGSVFLDASGFVGTAIGHTLSPVTMESHSYFLGGARRGAHDESANDIYRFQFEDEEGVYNNHTRDRVQDFIGTTAMRFRPYDHPSETLVHDGMPPELDNITFAAYRNVSEIGAESNSVEAERSPKWAAAQGDSSVYFPCIADLNGLGVNMLSHAGDTGYGYQFPVCVNSEGFSR